MVITDMREMQRVLLSLADRSGGNVHDTPVAKFPKLLTRMY